MPKEFEILNIESGRVLVILHSDCTISKQTILALLAELGINEAAVTFLFPEEAADCAEVDDLPVLIPIDQAIFDAPELDSASRQCAQAGGRVIILFGEAFSYYGLHPIAEKYGTQCGWSAVQLANCMKSADLAPPYNSDGAPVDRPKSDQVKC